VHVGAGLVFGEGGHGGGVARGGRRRGRRVARFIGPPGRRSSTRRRDPGIGVKSARSRGFRYPAPVAGPGPGDARPRREDGYAQPSLHDAPQPAYPRRSTTRNRPMRLTLRSVLAAAIVAAGLVSAAHADQLDDIKKKGELVVGVLGTDEPNSFLDPKTREIVGYEVDLAKAVAAKIGVKPVFKQLAVAARIPELQQGRVDLLAASLTHNKERESQVDFSLTTFVTGQKVIVKNSSGIKDLQQLAGKKVLTIKGGTQEANLKKVVPTADVVTFETSQQAFLALQQGKGVGFVDDEAALVDDWAKLGDARKDYTILPTSVSVEPLALGLRKNEPRFKEVVDDTLRGLEASGEANRIFMKWYGPDTKLHFDHRGFKIDSDRI
jgi:polar amino acid transport system substrate-binding protein